MGQIEFRQDAASAARAELAAGALGQKLGLNHADLNVGLHVAKGMMERGSLGEAFRIYTALVLCEPGNVEFQVGLSNCAVIMGENSLALQAASAIVAMAPKDPRGYFLSGRACLALGQWLEAEEDFRDALSHAKQARDALITGQSEKLLAQIAALKH